MKAFNFSQWVMVITVLVIYVIIFIGVQIVERYL
jgi:hypothetical protein